MRMSLTTVSRQIHQVVCGTTGSFPIWQIGGFGNVSESLQFYFTQQGIFSRLAANPPVQFGDLFANAASLANIFDQYRLVKVQCDVYFTNNSSGINNALQLPIIFGVIDKDDSTPLTSQAQALGFSTCKTMQLGNSSGAEGGKQSMYVNYPCVIQVNSQTAAATGPGALPSIVKPSPWIDNGFPEVEHHGVKFIADNAGVTNTQVGNVTFVFRTFMQYKNLK